VPQWYREHTFVVDRLRQPHAFLGRLAALIDKSQPGLHGCGEAGNHHLVLHLAELVGQLTRGGGVPERLLPAARVPLENDHLHRHPRSGVLVAAVHGRHFGVGEQGAGEVEVVTAVHDGDGEHEIGVLVPRHRSVECAVARECAIEEAGGDVQREGLDASGPPEGAGEQTRVVGRLGDTQSCPGVAQRGRDLTEQPPAVSEETQYLRLACGVAAGLGERLLGQADALGQRNPRDRRNGVQHARAGRARRQLVEERLIHRARSVEVAGEAAQSGGLQPPPTVIVGLLRGRAFHRQASQVGRRRGSAARLRVRSSHIELRGQRGVRAVHGEREVPCPLLRVADHAGQPLVCRPAPGRQRLLIAE
jgi:hypothetical protein